MTIDLLTEHDLPAALRLSTQAGWNQLPADWRRLQALWPRTCFAGRIDGNLVATSTLATYGAELGWVGMVLVDEAHRGRGYGGAILDAALEAGAKAGLATVGLDATDLGRPVYLKRGLKDIAGIDRWIGNATAFASAGNEHVENSVADFAKLLAYDRDVTGINRSDLLSHLSRESGVRWNVVRRDGAITGFAFLRPGRNAFHIGPVVAESADDAAGAVESLQVGRALPANSADRRAVPALHETVALPQSLLVDVPRGRMTDWLVARGFKCARRLTRMQIGNDKPALLTPRIFAAFGFETG